MLIFLLFRSGLIAFVAFRSRRFWCETGAVSLEDSYRESRLLGVSSIDLRYPVDEHAEPEAQLATSRVKEIDRRGRRWGVV